MGLSSLELIPIFLNLKIIFPCFPLFVTVIKTESEFCIDVEVLSMTCAHKVVSSFIYNLKAISKSHRLDVALLRRESS